MHISIPNRCPPLGWAGVSAHSLCSPRDAAAGPAWPTVGSPRESLPLQQTGGLSRFAVRATHLLGVLGRWFRARLCRSEELLNGAKKYVSYNIHINGTYHCSARFSVLETVRDTAGQWPPALAALAAAAAGTELVGKRAAAPGVLRMAGAGLPGYGAMLRSG